MQKNRFCTQTKFKRTKMLGHLLEHFANTIKTHFLANPVYSAIQQKQQSLSFRMDSPWCRADHNVRLARPWWGRRGIQICWRHVDVNQVQTGRLSLFITVTLQTPCNLSKKPPGIHADRTLNDPPSSSIRVQSFSDSSPLDEAWEWAMSNRPLRFHSAPQVEYTTPDNLLQKSERMRSRLRNRC